MQLTSEQRKALLDLKTLPDCDDIRFKENIKKTLINDELLIYLLNNKKLQDEDAEPSDYIGVNILPYYLVRDVQDDVQNYICYETSFDEVTRYNAYEKYGRITFYILCNHMTAIEQNTGIARHDLIASRIINDFNWTNIFGTQVHLISDKSGSTDLNFAYRTLIFQGEMPNSIVKTQNGVTRTVNNII